jgi:dTDP-4-amino-4,6-dideoxygalactose transaminase
MGDIGCFSLNDFKHISAGDGGMCIMKDEALYNKAFRFADKNYNRRGQELRAGIHSLAPNYLINELTSAVALAQLDKIEDICGKRNQYGEALTRGISGLPGIYAHEITEGCMSSYWFYMFRMNEAEAGCSREEFCGALTAEGINCKKGYIPMCVYEEELFRNKSVYSGTSFPFELPYYDGNIEYKKGLCPIAEKVLETAVCLTVNEFFTEDDLNDTISAIRKVSGYYARV